MKKDTAKTFFYKLLMTAIALIITICFIGCENEDDAFDEISAAPNEQNEEKPVGSILYHADSDVFGKHGGAIETTKNIEMQPADNPRINSVTKIEWDSSVVTGDAPYFDAILGDELNKSTKGALDIPDSMMLNFMLAIQCPKSYNEFNSATDVKPTDFHIQLLYTNEYEETLTSGELSTIKNSYGEQPLSFYNIDTACDPSTSNENFSPKFQQISLNLKNDYVFDKSNEEMKELKIKGVRFIFDKSTTGSIFLADTFSLSEI